MLLLVVSAAASGTVIGGIGYFLSKGSAEAVYQMGFRAGKVAQVQECHGKADASGGGTVVAFPMRS